MNHQLVLRPLLVILLFVSATSASNVVNSSFIPAPINSPGSASFALVNTSDCDGTVTSTIYKLYARNTMVFQTCVAEGNFTIFPFSGTYPTPQQIRDMGNSVACRAIFLAALLGGVPECNIAGFPLRAAAETELKIAVDMDNYPNDTNVIPSTERFVDMMRWRRNVNLATLAGLPADSTSKLFSEYSSNLYTITADGLTRLTADLKIEYRSTTDGSFSQDEIVVMPKIPGLRGSGSNEDAVVGASPASSTSSSSSLDSVTADTNATETVPPSANATSGASQLNKQLLVALASITAVIMAA